MRIFFKYNIFKKMIMAIVLFAFVLNSNVVNTMASAVIRIEQNSDLIWSNEYAEDRVLVTLTNEASMKFLNYSAQDFNEINCLDVEELTAPLDNQVQCIVESISRYITNGESLISNNDLNLGQYCQILCLYLSTPGAESVIDAIAKLSKRSDVLYAEPDTIFTLDKQNDDPDQFYGLVYNTDTRHHNPIQLEEAWDITTGSKNVKVGIIDTGIYSEHLDLVDNYEPALSADFSVDEMQDAPNVDNDGHGTHTAGIIGAKGDNGICVAGVCWDIGLVSLRSVCLVESEEGESEIGFYSGGVVEALAHAQSNNIKIVNLSGHSNTYSYATYMAISQYTGLVVCAAGNELTSIDVNPVYPANYDLPNIIVVGASNSVDDTLYVSNSDSTKGSNHGNKSVDLFAPTSIRTPDINGEYSWYKYSGTSASAPVVAGVAALMLSINPNLTTAQLKDIILRSVDMVPALQSYCATGGRINAYKAVWIASNLRFDYSYTYNSLDAYTHGVICDTCECTCRNADYSCGSGCDFDCDPCEECHIYYTELHNWRYQAEAIENIYTHRQYCYDCGYQTTGDHYWVLVSGGYKCSDCGMTSEFIPSIMNLPDPELELYLASLSDEELAEFIASLPEDQAARVTALLPSDDELLTE